MPRAIMILQQEHKSLAKLLVLMRRLANELDDGRFPDIELLQEIGEYLSGYPELCHHPKEDLIFQRLQEIHPEILMPELDLPSEHRQLSGLIESYVLSLRDYGGNATGNALAGTMRELVDSYEHHMLMEEQLFFPISISKLASDDWAAIGYAVSEQDDPLFDEASTKYARLRDKIFRSASKHYALRMSSMGESGAVSGQFLF